MKYILRDKEGCFVLINKYLEDRYYMFLFI